jgi:hypothetical protein
LVRYTAVLLLLLTAGCASVAPVPGAAQPPVVATQAAAPQPAATPVAPTTTPPAPKPAATPVTPATPPAPRVAPPRVAAPGAPAAPLTLDSNALEAQLRATKAIGVFTTISLKNQVDDLKRKFREHHEGKTTRTMTDLRRSYTLLLMKVLSLLQDTDQRLASVIVSSREAIWGPSILLVDEPSAGLDPMTSREIDELLVKTKQGGTTLVVVTHNIPSARAIGDRFAVLDQGCMLASGTIEALDASEEPLVQAFMRAQGGG